MYTVSFTKEELSLHVSALDNGVRTICQQIVSAPNAGLALKEAIDRLIKIDMQFAKLDAVYTKIKEEQESTPVEETKTSV